MNALGQPSRTQPLLIPSAWDWPEFWDYVHAWMRQQGYAHSTARLYRQVLRNFARFADRPPSAVTKKHIDHYFTRLGRGHCSAHWTAINLCTLRTIFDKLFGLDLLTRRSGPRRPSHLPEILSADEIGALLAAATSLRDRLLITLLYGCGLTVGELRRLRWQDLDPVERTLRTSGSLQLVPRTVRLPDKLVPLVHTAHAQSPLDAFVLQGASTHRPLTARWIEWLVRDCARRASIPKPVSPRTLRDTYAVHCLESGANIREVQTALGHCSVRTTLRYTRCTLPLDARSPLDLHRAVPERPAPPPPPENLPAEPLDEATDITELVHSPGGFFHCLCMQLGNRLCARRRATGSPRRSEAKAGPP